MQETDEEPHYLLDSNIVSEIVRPEPQFDVIKKLVEHTSDCAICAPSWHELLYGLHRMPDGIRKAFLENFICKEVPDDFTVKSYTKRAAEIHAELRAKVEKIGKPAPFSDSMIAAIALANHMVLVTRNTKHFEAIQAVSELQVENWFE